jgi:large subunit ribosomal protein L16
VIKPGTVLFEVAGLPREAAREVLARMAYKLPLRVRMIGRRPGE